MRPHQWVGLTLLVAVISCWIYVVPWFSAGQPGPKAAPPHGGCALDERIGPGVKVCADGTAWHGRVDGPEFLGDLSGGRAPIRVPAAPE